jgi:two-component system, response regulator
MDTSFPIEILLVEDNPSDAELTMLALKEKNLTNKLIHLKDGAEALEYIFATGNYASRKIDDLPKLILLDINLPKVNGIEVLQKIRSDERTKMIPVVILTSSKEDKDVIESYKLGVNSYIVKPVEFDKFRDAVGEVGLYWMLLNHPPK